MSGPACCATCWCVPRRGMHTSTQRSEAQFLCACVCPKHSNSSTGLQPQQQQQCSFASVFASPGTAAGKTCSCCWGGQDVSHSSSNTVDTTLSGNRVFAKVRFSKCTSLKIVPKAVFAVHFLKKGKNVLYRR